MNPISETKFEPKPSDVYAHGHLPLSHPGARVCEGHRSTGTRRGRGDRGGNGGPAGSGSGDDAAREGIRTASGTASGKASKTTRTTASSDAVWDWFYTRICQASDWELSYTDLFAGSVVRIRNPRDVLFEKMNLPSSLSDSAMRYMNSVYETEMMCIIKRLKVLRLIDLSQNGFFDEATKHRWSNRISTRAILHSGEVRTTVAAVRERRLEVRLAYQPECIPEDDEEEIDCHTDDDGSEIEDERAVSGRKLNSYRSTWLPTPMNKQKGLAIARMPKRLYDETVTQAQLSMCGLDPAFHTFQTDFVSAPGRAQASLDLGMMPLRYECKVAFLMVRQQLSKPRRLTAIEAQRLSQWSQRPSSIRLSSSDASNSMNAATNDAPMLREGDPAPPSAIRFLSTSVVIKIFSLLHEPRAICISPDLALVTELGVP
mmetsp:Transcript_11218/g.30013  ORF Transcript_11218/g.30013 Transcript_11218/m.30013 type:complete len:429 (+) Transcript_11218:762-2048(+)